MKGAAGSDDREITQRISPISRYERFTLRIIHVTNYFRDTHSHVGGAEQACFRTAMLARNHGCSSLIVATKPDRSDRCEFEFQSVPIIEDFTPRFFRQFVEAAKWYSFQYDPLARNAFRKILKRDNAEIVHFHNFQFLTLSLISAARKAGKKIFLSIYDYWLFCPTVMLVDPDKQFCSRAHGSWCVQCLPNKMRAFQRVLLSFRQSIVDHYVAMVDGFHVLSKHSGSVLEGYGISKSKIHVTPLTLPMEFRSIPESHTSPDPHSILFAGWLNERKGLHRLLEAMPAVLKQFPQTRLIAIGGKVRFGDEYEARLNEITDSNGFRDRVTFTGHLNPAAVKEYIQNSAVIVIPEQYQNMSPLLMIEAMSMGKPVVISRAGGIPEFIEDGVSGWLANPLDPNEFADKIIRVFRDPDHAKVMGEMARQRILTKCDDEVIWAKTREMYES